MNSLLSKIADINRRWKDMPRRMAIILATCLCLWILGAAFKYIAPLVCALVFSWVIKPLAKLLEKGLSKLKIPRRIGVLIAVILVFGLLAALLTLLVSVISNEMRDMLNKMPLYIRDVSSYIRVQLENGMVLLQEKIGDSALQTVYDMLMTALNRVTELASSLAGTLVSFTWSAVASIPDIMFVVIFTIMESYYLVADRDDIARFFCKWLPDSFSGNFVHVKKVMILGVRAQIVTAILQMFAAAIVLAVGFAIIGVDYALMLATLIAVLDALPVIGAGLIMFPMMGYYLIVGEYMLALGVFVLYFVVQVVKRIMEPKLMGKQMKLNQLATMIAMYAGYKLIGFLGIIVGPLMLMLFTVVLDITAIPERGVSEGDDAPATEGE